MDKDFSYISDNYKTILYNINQAKVKFNREDDVQLMAVTKSVNYDTVNYAVSCGITLIGENRVQEYLSKYEFYTKKAEIHFIGGLQSNKVKYIIDKVDMIHSLDSIKLAREIDKQSNKYSKCMDVLVEVNIGDEETKNGVSSEELLSFIQDLKPFTNIRLRGLMTIPPRSSNSNEHYFAQMNELFNKSKTISGNEFNILSMGMSNDYVLAVKHGANILRIGSALFRKNIMEE